MNIPASWILEYNSMFVFYFRRWGRETSHFRDLLWYPSHVLIVNYWKNESKRNSEMANGINAIWRETIKSKEYVGNNTGSTTQRHKGASRQRVWHRCHRRKSLLQTVLWNSRVTRDLLPCASEHRRRRETPLATWRWERDFQDRPRRGRCQDWAQQHPAVLDGQWWSRSRPGLIQVRLRRVHCVHWHPCPETRRCHQMDHHGRFSQPWFFHVPQQSSQRRLLRRRETPSTPVASEEDTKITGLTDSLADLTMCRSKLIVSFPFVRQTSKYLLDPFPWDELWFLTGDNPHICPIQLLKIQICPELF